MHSTFRHHRTFCHCPGVFGLLGQPWDTRGLTLASAKHISSFLSFLIVDAADGTLPACRPCCRLCVAAQPKVAARSMSKKCMEPFPRSEPMAMDASPSRSSCMYVSSSYTLSNRCESPRCTSSSTRSSHTGFKVVSPAPPATARSAPSRPSSFFTKYCC